MRFVSVVGRLSIALMVLVAVLDAAEPPPAEAPLAGAYHFVVDQPAWYFYELKQEVGWESAGDKLNYTTVLTWTVALRAQSVSESQAVVKATIIAVEGSHQGAGSEHRVSAKIEGSDKDPLLGHLLLLSGITLVLTIDPATGLVSKVDGGEEIVKRINARTPAAFAGDPPPLDAAAKATYSSEALARWWSQVLVLPATSPQLVPMNPPLTGTIERRWTGSEYSLGFPAGVTALSAQLLADPTPLAVTLTNLAGKGKIALQNGLPGISEGEMTFDLAATALTQPVVQHHHLHWGLTRFTPKK